MNSPCSASARIYIGNLMLASCNGNAGAVFDFSQMNNLFTGSAYSNTPVCLGGDIYLFAYPPNSPIYDSFAWAGPNGFSSNAQNPIINNATNLNIGAYTVTMKSTSNPNIVASTVVSLTPSLGNNSISGGSSPICSGSNPGTITGSTPTGGDGTYTYLWESSTISSTSGFTDAGGTNTVLSYAPGNLTQTTWFRRVAYSGGCSIISNVIQIDVNTLSVAPTGISGTTAICLGNSTTLSIVGGSPGTGAVAEWFIGTCGGSPIGTGSSITVNPIVNTSYFVRYRGTCNTTACVSITITLYSALVPGAHNTVPLTECAGYNPAQLSFTIPISRGKIPYTYQWRLNGTAILGETNETFNPPQLTVSNTYSYDCVVSDDCGSSFTTTPKVIVIVADPSVSIVGNASICQNESTTFTANIINGTGSYAYQWRSSPTLVSPNWTDIPGATNSTFNPPTNIDGTYYYQVFIDPAHPECNQTTSLPFTFTVKPLPITSNIYHH